MAKVVAVGNFKGGVGKTTVSTNLAFSLAERGKRVLLIDFDAQGHAGQYVSGNEEISAQPGGAERLFEGEPNLRGMPTASGVDVLHGHRQLGSLDEGEYDGDLAVKIRDYVAGLDYDFIIIDTPPNLAFRMIASLMWADYFLLVTKPDRLSMNGTKQMLNVIAGWVQNGWVKQGFKFGILMNMVDRSSAASKQEAEDARAGAPDYVVPIELTYRRDAINRAYENKIPVWKMPRIPKDVAAVWRDLPVSLGLVKEEVK